MIVYLENLTQKNWLFDEKHLIINKKNKITFSQEDDLDNINWKKFSSYVFEFWKI